MSLLGFLGGHYNQQACNNGITNERMVNESVFTIIGDWRKDKGDERKNWMILFHDPEVLKARMSVSQFKWTFYEEMDLLRQQWKVILFAFIMLMYSTLVVFLNLALYFYEPGPRLPDLGHDLIPPLSKAREHLADHPMKLIYPSIGVFTLGPYIYSLIVRREASWFSIGDRTGRHIRPPFVINVMRRFGVVYMIGHLLRAFSYLPTNIPGSAEHCIEGFDNEVKKKSLSQCFYKTASVDMNCGDLMFSGHMLLCLLAFLVIDRYGGYICFKPRWWIPSVLQKNPISLMILILAVTQSILILAARHHYTSDVICAYYVTPMLWYWHNTYLSEEDVVPDWKRIASKWVLVSNDDLPTA